MEATQSRNELFPWAHMEVVGVSENDLSSQAAKFVGAHGLHGGLRAHRHEDGGANGASTRVDGRRAGPAF